MKLPEDERIEFRPRDLLSTPTEYAKREHLDRYRLASSRVAWNSRVLDLGCGTGYGSYLLAQSGAAHVVGVDGNSAAVMHAQTWFSHPRVTFETGDIGEDLHVFDEHGFEMVVAFEILEHVLDLQNVMRNIVKCLVPNGTLIMSVPVIPTTMTNLWHRRDFTQEDILDLLWQDFDVRETWVQNSWIFVACASVVG